MSSIFLFLSGVGADMEYIAVMEHGEDHGLCKGCDLKSFAYFLISKGLSWLRLFVESKNPELRSRLLQDIHNWQKTDLKVHTKVFNGHHERPRQNTLPLVTNPDSGPQGVCGWA